MKLIKKVITILMIFVFILGCADFSAHAYQPETPESQEVYVQAKTLLKACKKYNINKIRKCVIHKNNVYHIIDPAIVKYIRKTQKKYFTYEITDIRINDNYAYVDITYSNFDTYSMTENFLRDMLDKKLKNKSLDLKKNMTPMLIQYFKWYLKDPSEDYICDSVITLKFKKKGKAWKLYKNNSKLYDLMDGGLANALRDFSKNPIKFYYN